MNNFGGFEEDGLSCNSINFEDLREGERVTVDEWPDSQKEIDYVRRVEGILVSKGDDPGESKIRLTSIIESPDEYNEEIGNVSTMCYTWGWRAWTHGIQLCSPPITPKGLMERERGTKIPTKKNRYDWQYEEDLDNYIKEQNTPSRKRQRDQGWGKIK
jgi:hypothetical protein